jgi:hypothetical protein
MSNTRKIFNTLQVVCAVSAFAAFGLAPTASLAATIDVTPTSMGTWAFNNRDAGGNIGAEATASGGMVTGPATPPLGTGSANLATGNGVTGGDGAEELRNTGYVGLALSSISALSYSTYATAWNGQQLPYIVLYVSGGNRLWFEPTYSPSQGAVALNTWQTWNALTGGWYEDTGPGGQGVANVVSWSTILAANLGGTIVNQGNGLGGIRISSGFASPGDQFNTYVDNFTLNDTTFNFDPAAATPLPAALPLFATGLGALGLLGWRRKRKAAALAA